MIQFLRFWTLALIATLRWGGRALIASWRGVRDEPGGVYDQVVLGWSQAMLRASRISVEVRGRERIPPGAAVYVANHLSMVDIWVLVPHLPQAPKFIMKKELLRVPFFGRAARAAGHIEIDRGNRTAAFASYEVAAGVIRRGASACVFAEGTRSRTGRLLPFKKGPFVLAIAAHVPVVPVFLEGTWALMPPLALRPKAGSVTIHFGHPLSTAGLNYDARDRLAAEARAAIQAMGAVE